MRTPRRNQVNLKLLLSKKKTLVFTEKDPQYARNPKEVFTWCEKLENHLSNHEGQTNKQTMRGQIGVLLQPSREGLAFDTNGTEEFFA